MIKEDSLLYETMVRAFKDKDAFPDDGKLKNDDFE